MRKEIAIIGGGTVSHVRSHLALCAPAYGKTARELKELLKSSEYSVNLYLTKMADPYSTFETNQDIENLVDDLIKDANVRCIIFNPALVDFNGQIGVTPSGKYATRLETCEGLDSMTLTPTEKIIGKIRKVRKDIFVVGFKTTANATTEGQYAKGLKLLKTNSLNLVLANDVVTRENFIIAPEETQYGATKNRASALCQLAQMVVQRLDNHFTRSTVVEGLSVPWDSEQIPENLRTVVNHCIEQGAYKTVLGKTAGHFAVKLSDSEILTTIRKSNFNNLKDVGLVRITSVDKDSVVAHGFKPSVGGQSQRIIFNDHLDAECIVHFHCPPIGNVPSQPQFPYECGSHECGRNTSTGLQRVDLGGGFSLKVVNLIGHGPNIVFSKNTPAEKVIEYIDRHFCLADKTGGLVPASIQ